ncbi:MAG: hypothetical protein LBE59_06975 [Nevskiaceae bacterium]|jgi:hypothetical protein|nr:hypothetical protein [Nevskiaceae bacterium]
MLNIRTLRPFHAVAAVALTAVAAPVLAHHSGAMFDSSKTVTITGTITQFNWTNPHSSFKVAVTNAAGKEEIWAIEMNAPQNLMVEGWKRTTLKPGDKVSVLVSPLRDGKPGGSYRSITLADGTTLNGNGPGQTNYDAQQGAAKK